MSDTGFRFTDPRQERIYRGLLLIGPGPAAFFKDACVLMSGRGGLETTPHVVAHLLREVESGLRDVLLPYGFERPAPCPHCQNRPGSHKQEVKAILSAYGIEQTDFAAEAWLRLSGWDEDTGLARLAHRRALGPPRSTDEGVRRAWDEIQALLDAILEKFQTRFLDSFTLLDELLAKESPGAADAERLRNSIPNNLVTFGHFFDKLENPKWIPLLEKERFFAHPPEPERDDEAGTVAFAPWPASRYLVRMAKVESAQAVVLEVALNVPDTDNVRVYEDLSDAARALPVALAARLAPRAARGLASPHQMLLPEKLGALVAHLAAGGEARGALDLAAQLLEVLPGEGQRASGTGEEDAGLWSPEARARFDLWGYGRTLKKDVPALVQAAGLDALKLLCRLLADALRHSARRGDDGKPDDYSAIWRPAIEDGGERDSHGVKEALVSAVRDAAEAIVREDLSRLPEVVRTLEERGWHVFERIALHVLFSYPAGCGDLICERLTNRKLFEESAGSQLRREYRRLAREHFGQLRPEDQTVILGWVEEGPVREVLKQRFQDWEGRDPTDGEIAGYVKQWQLERLAPIAQALPDPWIERYEALVRELGAPGDSDFAIERSGVFAGPTSPLSTEELKTRPVEDIIEHLKAWVPPQGFMAPSREGAGRALTDAVAADPTRFLPSLPGFRELHPIYVRSLLEGFARAGGEKRVFPWMDVVELCRWVIEQPHDPPDEETDGAHHHEDDPDWGWTRKTIARLLVASFENTEGSIPFGLRGQVWAVLRPLTEDPEPTPEYEARHGGSNMDPPALAINTVRGDAMHAVIKYALWVRRHLQSGPDAEASIARGFDEMPEVREVLERHLDPRVEPSAAIRSAYGRYLPWLILLDRAWVASNVQRICPEDPLLSHLRDAAWDTYIVFCRPYNDALAVLRDEYAKAIDRIGTRRERTPGPGNPDQHLAEHLMVFYWLGKLELDGPDDLLTRFYARSDGELGRETIEFIGRSIKNTEGDLEEEVALRLVRLWEQRVEVARATNEFTELETFGWWFTSGKLDESWTLRELLVTLRLTKQIDPDFLVFEELSRLAPTRPGEVVECLHHMVEGARDQWRLQARREEIEKSLRVVLASGDAAARKHAIDLVNVLAAKGHAGFRALLGPSVEP